MVTEQIKREWKLNPKSFFILKEIEKHYPGFTYGQAKNWPTAGVRISRAKKAKPILLETVRVGRFRKTNVAAIDRFWNRINGGD